MINPGLHARRAAEPGLEARSDSRILTFHPQALLSLRGRGHPGSLGKRAEDTETCVYYFPGHAISRNNLLEGCNLIQSKKERSSGGGKESAPPPPPPGSLETTKRAFEKLKSKSCLRRFQAFNTQGTRRYVVASVVFDKIISKAIKKGVLFGSLHPRDILAIHVRA